MRYIYLHIFFFFFSVLGVQAEMISSTHFENAVAGQSFTLDKWKSEGFTTGSWHQGLDSRTMIDSSVSMSGEKSLRVFYPKGEFGPADNGAQVELLFEPRKEAFISYWMRFSPDFSFGTTNEGGKLPGLSGGADCSGGSSCDGTNGFSARFMWRGGGRIALYLYHMDKPEKYGEDYEFLYPDGSSVVFERGKWYHLEERVRINSAADAHDGEVEIWVNGVQVVFVGGLRFTTNGDMVDKLYISTFHGGDDETWAPKNDSYIWFDDIRIGTSREDTRFQTCVAPSLGANRSLCAEKSVELSVPYLTDQSYNWYKDGTVVSHENALTIDDAGTYVLKVDSDWCSSADTIVVYEQINSAVVDDYFVCQSSYQSISADLPEDDVYSFQWMSNGRVLSDRSGVEIKNAGDYSLLVSAPGCDDYIKSFALKSGLLSIADTSGSVGQSVSLSTADAIDCLWYEALDDDAPFFVGSQFSTIFPDGAKTYYVKDANAFSGYVGKKHMSVDKSYTENRFERKMVFEVYKALTVDSVTIYPAEALDAVIRILSEDGKTVVWERTYNGLSQGEVRLPVGAELVPGKYMMDAEGSTGRLRHANEKDTDISFPYEVEGLISIKGSNLSWIDAKPYYLFFFNWKISSGNVCARTPVVLTGNKPNGIANQSSDGQAFVSLKSNSIHVQSAEPVRFYRLFTAHGAEVASGIPDGEKQFDIPVAPLKGQIYLLELFCNGKSCTIKF